MRRFAAFILAMAMLFVFFPFAETAAETGETAGQDTVPELIIKSDTWGYVPANRVMVMFADKVSRDVAAYLISTTGAVIVDEFAFINLYQVETGGQTEEELIASLRMFSRLKGVEAAFPNAATFLSDQAGTPCSPLGDAVYADPANDHYNLIGMENAWKVIKGSGVNLNNVKVGALDHPVYTGSDEFGGKVKLSGDTTDVPVTENDKVVNGGFTHGTNVAHVIAADPENGGMVGVASVLGENLEIEVKNNFDSAPYLSAATADEDDLTQISYGNGVAYTDKTLVNLKEMVDGGATVINCSFNFKPPSDIYAPIARAYRKFFAKMQEEKPHVIFVASAGNAGNADKTTGALNGINDCPAGIAMPNVITVASINNDGSRAEFSGFATGDGEVTLAAPGVQMVVGVDENGQPVKKNGTSYSAPQVSAAIALIQSINPELNAGQIKELLVATAAPGVTTGNQSIPIPQGLGAGVLRVDEAVLKTINDMRVNEGQPAFTMQQLLDVSTVTLTAAWSGADYVLTANIPASLTKTATVKIEINGQHVLTGDTNQTVAAGDSAVWTLTPDGGEVFVRVTRLDSSACAYMTLAPDTGVAGTYQGAGYLSWHGDNDPIEDFQAVVSQNGNQMTISLANGMSTILTGTYDEASTTFVGRDVSVSDDVWASTWWEWGDTTIVFDTAANPPAGAGVLTVLGTDTLSGFTVEFSLTKVSD